MPLNDVMPITPTQNWTKQCLDHGFVRLVDCMPRLVPESTADYAIAEAARKSYKPAKTISDDETLIRFMMRLAHTSPFEQVEFKWHMKLPIFVARQLGRTRTASMNELSQRYTEVDDDFFFPDIEDVRAQSKSNKQGSEGKPVFSNANNFVINLRDICSSAYEYYQEAIERGISREQARIGLPLNIYTEWYFKLDLHNTLRLLSSRCDSHAQKETQVYANAMLELIEPIVPVTIQAWEDYDERRGAIKLTRLEVDAIKFSMSLSSPTSLELPNTVNKREQQEWVAKSLKLGFVEPPK